jgi:hypothetical protein
VTAVAIINFVLGGLQILGGLLVVVLGGTLIAAFTGAAKQAGADAGQAGQAAGMGFAIILGVALCIWIIGALFIFAGIGTLKRKQYGRIITLILAALFGVLALFSLIGIGANPVGAIIQILIYGGYCVFSYVTLLNAQNAAEFR